ncbi:peptide transporter family 1 isoform X2 [Scaptodrosophila lebanonensis]|uniref:Oligopeptide transporter 1 n=1 Tax=Drosophila lebanonensis TaxID=7225 RepID=A0A6J2U0I4_DROLE|nr:peptide transporter family 1 isoform X2 [Scaptodrosophila lebanonensis]
MTDTENEIQPAAVPVESGGESVPVATISPMPSALTDEPKQAPTAAPEEPKATENGKALVEAKKISEPVSNGHDFNDAANVAEAEGQQKKLPYPKSVFFIISNEFCERFNYYGMRTVLVLFLSYQLGYSNDTATVVFHIFTMFVYFLCVFGAIISDSWLGKFKTILNLSLVYICGSVLLTLGAIGPLNLPVETFTMIGLALIALGSGGIKPCVSAFGGDQFKMPEQVKQITTFFSLFYFSINAGSLISTSVTPILREDVHCFGEKECYPLAFGVPAVLMIVSVIIIVLGRPLYKIKPPAGNMVVLVSKTIWTALRTKCKEKKTNPREHWLDYADQKYDRQLIDDVKVLMRVLFLYLPLPVFWALFDQQGSRWTFQATRMDGDMGSWDIKPDQLQVLNPLLILVFIPLYDVAFYPALRLVGISRPLQKLTMGGVLAGIAFIISGVVELNLEKTYPTLPYAQNAQLRVFNTDNCAYNFESNLPARNSFTVEPLSVYEDMEVSVPGTFQMTYTITAAGENCFAYPAGTHTLTDKTAWSLFLNSKNTTSTYWLKDYVNKPSNGRPNQRTVANVGQEQKILWRTTKGSVDYNELANETQIVAMTASNYEVLIDDKLVAAHRLRTGGIYTLLVNEESDGVYKTTLIEVTEPNSMNILWLIPQYVVMTLAEVMFSVTGLEFSYAQAPPSMKSVLQACWLLTVAFGNVIVVIIAEAAFFDSQASEFFLFAGLMFVDMLIFMVMAYKYQPNNPLKNDEAQPLTEDTKSSAEEPKRQIEPLEGIENKGSTINE